MWLGGALWDEVWVPDPVPRRRRQADVSGELGERYLLVQIQRVGFSVSEAGLG